MVKIHKQNPQKIKPTEPIYSEEFQSKETWSVFKIMSEFVDAFDTMKDIGRAVTIWGSARAQPGTKYYKLAVNTGEVLSKAGYSVITGGGPGLMRAGNEGAQKGKGVSIGLNIDIPSEQNANPFLDLALDFNYFFSRKVMFVKHSSAFVLMPGGFGTMDELFECMTLIQTGKTKPYPVIMMGKSYWKGLFDWIKNSVLAEGFISKDDLKLFHFTDDPKETLSIIKKFCKKYYRE